LPKPSCFTGNNIIEIKADEDNILKELKKEGFFGLGIVLSEKQIDIIKQNLSKINCYHTAYGEADMPINITNPDSHIQLGTYNKEDLIKIPELLRIANDSRILNIVSGYLGVKPTLSSVNCWWSFSNRDRPKEAQFFHRDLDDFKFVKIFFYLTDVNEDSGPHIFVKKSHITNKLLQLKRFTDEEVHMNFDTSNIEILTKPKGSCFIEDTYGIHKGQLPINGNRLVLQFQYSGLPLFAEKYAPVSLSLSETINFDKYVNRLFVKF
jgi:hypothetical protein